jgi:hypothetical protein
MRSVQRSECGRLFSKGRMLLEFLMSQSATYLRIWCEEPIIG